MYQPKKTQQETVWQSLPIPLPCCFLKSLHPCSIFKVELFKALPMSGLVFFDVRISIQKVCIIFHRFSTVFPLGLVIFK